jgi:phytoene synthase
MQSNHPHSDMLLGAFTLAIKRFPVPTVLWDNFFTAMHQDLQRHRFSMYSEFVDYAEGAAVAPATIYLYLIAAERHDEEDSFRLPKDFDLIRCGRELGLFAYIAHILRDLPRDITSGNHGLWYLAGDDMATHGVTEQMLYAALASRRASPPLKALVRDLVERALTLVRGGRAYLRVLDGNLSPDRAFILELIVRTYEAVLEKIILRSYDLMTDSHRLSDAAKERIALEVAELMGFTEQE